MGDKDFKTNRERKKDSKKKDFDKNGKYSNKHIRITEEKQNKLPDKLYDK
tara:strand:- start:2236 stop:2385 length:150 start_codon:yes stop_codon:yes gene_type:complete